MFPNIIDVTCINVNIDFKILHKSLLDFCLEITNIAAAVFIHSFTKDKRNMISLLQFIHTVFTHIITHILHILH
jgi:hypothetical protein